MASGMDIPDDIDGVMDLVLAIGLQPEPPCEKHDCEFQHKCSAEQLACKAFVRYVRTGVAGKPSGLPSTLQFAEMSRGEYNYAQLEAV